MAMSLKLLGPPCGVHGAVSLYKSFRYFHEGKKRKLSLGEFFFVQVLEDYPVGIGELQLLWEDKSATPLCSVKVYFLPEHTQDGRQCFHGDDEVLAVSDKIVLRIEDLVLMIRDGVSWGIGIVPYCDKSSPKNGIVSGNKIKTKRNPAYVGEASTKVIVLNFTSYCRYRAILKRLEGSMERWIVDGLIHALGGFTTCQEDARVLFCRDDFDFPELDNLDIRCDHLLPVPKGKPLKRKARLSQDSDESNDGMTSDSSYQPPASVRLDIHTPSSLTVPTLQNNINKDHNTQVPTSIYPKISSHDAKRKSPRNSLLQSKKSNKDETKFLHSWKAFMKSQNLPVDKIPSLGFKQLDMFYFYTYAKKLGGYAEITKKRRWKHLYNRLGGDIRNTSAATCTRKHYERLLLPYECYMRGHSVPKKEEIKASTHDQIDTLTTTDKVKVEKEVKRLVDTINTSVCSSESITDSNTTIDSTNSISSEDSYEKSIKSVIDRIGGDANKQKNNTHVHKIRRKAVRDSKLMNKTVNRTNGLVTQAGYKYAPNNIEVCQKTDQKTNQSLTGLYSYASIKEESIMTTKTASTTVYNNVILSTHIDNISKSNKPKAEDRFMMVTRPSVIQHAPSHPSQLNSLYTNHTAHSRYGNLKSAHQLKRAYPGYVEQSSISTKSSCVSAKYELNSAYYAETKRHKMTSEQPNFYLSQMKNLADIQRSSASNSTKYMSNSTSYVDDKPTDLSMKRQVVAATSSDIDSGCLDLSLPKNKQQKNEQKQPSIKTTKSLSVYGVDKNTSSTSYNLSLNIPPAHSHKAAASASQIKQPTSVPFTTSMTTFSSPYPPQSPSNLIHPHLSPSFVHPAFYMPSAIPPILPQTLSPMDIQKLYEAQLQISANQMAAYRELLKNGLYHPVVSPYMPTQPTYHAGSSTNNSQLT